MSSHGPGEMIERAMAFQTAKLVLTGLELGLFELLAHKPLPENDIRAELGLGTRGTELFLAALVEMGILERDGDAYRNGAETGSFLVPGAPAYLGGFLNMANQVMYPAWTGLGESLRTDEPQAATFSGTNMFEQLYEDAGKRDDFVRMAESISRPLVPVLAETFDWAAHKSVLDLGGCRGDVLGHLVRAHPHLDATVLDLPQLEPAFHDHMAELGTTGLVGFHAADFFTDRLPAADVVMIGHCMIDWTDEQRRTLIANVFPAVRSSGAFLIWDPMLVAGEEGYLRNLIRGLNLQLMTPYSTSYRLGACVAWLEEAGFADVDHRSLGYQDITLVTAYKGEAP
ncbi:MAG: methyltransferase [Actinophytocola sp.]|uniref:methyltransferase n=1 Tax=Actinophytocola sp. TaxID=1872138 RepID=UPI003C75383E